MPYNELYNMTLRLKTKHFILFDLFILLISPLVALFLRLDGLIDFNLYGSALAVYAMLFMVPKLIIFYSLGLYKHVWRTASVDEMGLLIIMGVLINVVQIFLYSALHILNFPAVLALPHSLAVLDCIVSISFVCGLRFSIRLLERANLRNTNTGIGQRVLIIGAGFSGATLVDEMHRNSQLNMIPVAFADDDPNKLHARVRGVIVAGDTRNIYSIVEEYKIDKIIIAIPSAPGSQIRRIVRDCSNINIETLTLPGIFEILNGKISINSVRKIQVDDLLRRAPIRTDSKAVTENTGGKKIIVTGAGGSIGSEICRQLLRNEPAELVLLGHGENSIFEIEQELSYIKKKNAGGTNIQTVIADVRDRERISEIFAEIRPDIIYHAAAHKHVPLMELNPKEAVTNNIAGTKNLIDASIQYNVQDFILISSDKAVNPTNIMGASKRAAEMIVLDAAKKYGRRFSAVRFGNVLGSRGSVLHTFKRQIANGGPVTITHADIRRYFMTIPEAVQLVLQASVLGDGGDIFMLDMGDPIKLIDLAKDIIRLSGLKVERDIKIQVVGLRPGEKLFEELFIKGETYEKTRHEKILIAKNASNLINPNVGVKISDIIYTVDDLTREQVYNKLCNIVPEFSPVFLNKPIQHFQPMIEQQAKISIA